MPAEIAVLGVPRPFLLAELERDFTVVRAWDTADKLAALQAHADRIRGVVTSGMFGLPTAFIEALPRLEICAVNGVGLETTDLATARARGVAVTTTPVLHDDVADLAVMLAMAASRRLVEGDRFVREGRWLKGRLSAGRKFTGRRAGILGFGRIGSAIARRLAGFDMPIAYHDPSVQAQGPITAYPSAVELASASDILFLCAAGGPGANKIVDGAVLEALGPEGIFVNIARGWLVDEPALVSLLRDGRLGAAGLDVFADEPNVPAELIGMANVVLTPHVASNTVETSRAMDECVMENLRSWFAGRGAVTPVR